MLVIFCNTGHFFDLEIKQEFLLYCFHVTRLAKKGKITMHESIRRPLNLMHHQHHCCALNLCIHLKYTAHKMSKAKTVFLNALALDLS